MSHYSLYKEKWTNLAQESNLKKKFREPNKVNLSSSFLSNTFCFKKGCTDILVLLPKDIQKIIN